MAIKTIQKEKLDNLALKEIKLLDKIRHKNVIFIAAVSENITQYHIVMEYFKSYSLRDILFEKQIKEKFHLQEGDKNKITYQISSAITFLHMSTPPIFHRDIKPSNILVGAHCEAKLCDLGLGVSNCLDSNLLSTCAGIMRGTFLYMAPEIIMSYLPHPANGKTDIWSFACSLVEMYSGKQVWDCKPFQNNAWFTARFHLKARHVPDLQSFPLFLQPLVRKCFMYVPSKRPDIIELLTACEEEIIQ